jgi:RNA polymerase sigma-70 factor (ECF subfamily)
MITSEQEAQHQARLAVAHAYFQKGLHTHAFFKVHDKALSNDLVQDTFIKTWRYLVRGGEIQTMKAFLYHILNNLIIDEYRKHKTTSLDVLLSKGFEPKVADSGRLFDLLDGKAALILIMRLPKTYQKVMRMKYIQDLTLEEMALVTGQTKNTLSVQAHRGLEKLKALYHREESLS